jgi:hypothetical protein
MAGVSATKFTDLRRKNIAVLTKSTTIQLNSITMQIVSTSNPA